MKRNSFISLAGLALAWMTGCPAWAWDEPAQVDGVYQIGTASELEWFAEYVNSANSDDASMLTAKAVLTADIDMIGISHTPIGPSTTYKFDGEFDGQHHVISNMIIDLPNQENVGLFGLVRGNAVIKNIIIDGTCSIKGKNRVAAIIGCNQTVGDKKLAVLNCVNMAPVHAYSGVAAGIIGAGQSQYPYFKIHNCVNTGAITTDATNNWTVAFHGWNNSAGGNAEVWSCYNAGTLSRIDGGNNLFRGVNRSVLNSYDLVYTASDMQSQTNIPSERFKTDDPLHSGELCYYLNHGIEMMGRSEVSVGEEFTQDLSDPNSIPMPNAAGPKVYQVAALDCAGNPKGGVAYSNEEGGSTKDDHNYDPATGLCTVCSAPNVDWMSAEEDGYFYLGTPAQVEWFSEMVRAGYGAMNAKLTADIDYEGVPDAHRPIGTSVKKYFGHFDGQGHRIKGMVLTTASKLDNRGYDGNGFFGSVRGGGTSVDNIVTNEVIIENLIIDATCSIQHDNNFAAGVVAHINSRNNEQSNIIIRNCGNEANVSSTGKNVAGILGCVEATNVGLKLYNLWNKGTIVGQAGESAAICAWTGQRNVDGEVDVEGCWNIGEVTGVDGNGYNMIRRNTNIRPRNIVDLCTTNAGNQGKVAVLNTENPIESGELCYLLNGDQSTIVYTQTLGTDEMPVYGTTSAQVYQAGTVDCLGAAVGGINYNNVSGETQQLGHQISEEMGMCSVCHTQFQEPALVDGYYELKNAGNVEWFSAQVAAGNLTINGKMMNDIDFYNIENLHSPIGPNTANKFNGTFDGQGFRIKNLIIERPSDSNIGFFGFLRGNNANTTVKNFIMDASCTIHGYNRVGAITGSCQNSGTLITLENIINEATVIAEHQDAAGIIGGQEGNGPKWLIRNVLNLGTITAKNEHPYAGALCCYLGGNGESVIENFVNLGTINGHEGGNIGRIAGTYTNIIDLSDTNPEGSTASGNIGFDSGLTKADIASGKLAYTVGWWQKIGVDEYPTPFEKEDAVVYRTGEERCDGADSEGTVYSNTEGTIVTGSHDYNATTGLCDLCNQPNADFKSLVDGAYELGSVVDVKWFEAMVSNGNPAINGKMTVDALDFEGGSCRIGTDANSYRGTFQGNGVVVSNFVIDNAEAAQGFFGWVTGGADISGIVFDNTCSISCNERAGIIGAAKDGGTVKITRLGNEGTVTTTSRNAAGIIGTDLSGACTLLIDQCYSTGAIKGGYESAQIAGWTGSTSKITNSWSCASVEGIQEGRPFSRYGGDAHDAQFENCFSTMTENNAGLTFDVPAEKFESGEVAYALNTAAGKQCFGQFLGIDKHPVFDSPEVSYIGAVGYATLYDTTTGYVLNGDVKAYVAVLNQTWLELTEIENVPVGVPVILKAEDNGYYNKFAYDVPAINIANDLKGTDVDTAADGTMYVLAKPAADEAQPEGYEVGFYKATGTIKAGKAYFQSASGVKAFYFAGDDATGISTIDNGQLTIDNAAIYNLAGQRVNKAQKGIYIVNGKKVLK
ncbi:MAG: hypothetical protein J6W52_12235 [Bacteroidaceae bacterium]|nr:hypothetical protein [Bacteroidaceae bacterium]